MHHNAPKWGGGVWGWEALGTQATTKGKSDVEGTGS